MVNVLMLTYGFLVSAIVLVIAKILNKEPEPIFGIYRRRNGAYWIKVSFMYIILLFKTIRHRLFPKNEEYSKKLDNVQRLSSAPKAVDAVYFNGGAKNGDHLCLGVARRPNRLVDGFLFLKIKALDFGLLESPKLPDTSLFNGGEIESYEAEGIKVIPLEPMKAWKITFNGQLREANNKDKLHDVTIDAIYRSDEPWFNYEFDMDPWSMAKILAYETWSQSYFKNVKESHQLHYEQFGIVDAKITVDSQEYNIKLDTARDHSIGTHRDWASFRRYAVHWLTTENGDHFSIGSICQPISYSRMQIGYVYNAHDRKMYPITNIDFDLYQYGELGTPPRDYALTFRAGKTDYAMQVNISDAPYFFISKQWESKIYECFCTIEVNGVKGYGGVEWEYRNIEGRNATVE